MRVGPLIFCLVLLAQFLFLSTHSNSNSLHDCNQSVHVCVGLLFICTLASYIHFTANSGLIQEAYVDVEDETSRVRHGGKQNVVSAAEDCSRGLIDVAQRDTEKIRSIEAT